MHLREPFDPDRQMIVNKPFRWAGAEYTEGTLFPPNITGKRKMRQLYDARYLRHGPALIEAPAAPAADTTEAKAT
jgi:hypothetical protein